MKRIAIVALVTLAFLPAAQAQFSDNPFFKKLTGDWEGAGKFLTTKDDAQKDSESTAYGVTGDDKKSFAFEGDLRVKGAGDLFENAGLSFYRMVYTPAADGKFKVSFESTDSDPMEFTATIDTTAMTATLEGPKMTFVKSFNGDKLSIKYNYDESVAQKLLLGEMIFTRS